MWVWNQSEIQLMLKVFILSSDFDDNSSNPKTQSGKTSLAVSTAEFLSLYHYFSLHLFFLCVVFFHHRVIQNNDELWASNAIKCAENKKLFALYDVKVEKHTNMTHFLQFLRSGDFTRTASRFCFYAVLLLITTHVISPSDWQADLSISFLVVWLMLFTGRILAKGSCNILKKSILMILVIRDYQHCYFSVGACLWEQGTINHQYNAVYGRKAGRSSYIWTSFWHVSIGTRVLSTNQLGAVISTVDSRLIRHRNICSFYAMYILIIVHLLTILYL